MSRANRHASIVIVAHNELKYTKFCIESVLRCTQYPYKLVLVDNGSSDGTEEYFRSIDGAVVIRNETNTLPRELIEWQVPVTGDRHLSLYGGSCGEVFGNVFVSF